MGNLKPTKCLPKLVIDVSGPGLFTAATVLAPTRDDAVAIASIVAAFAVHCERG